MLAHARWILLLFGYVVLVAHRSSAFGRFSLSTVQNSSSSTPTLQLTKTTSSPVISTKVPHIQQSSTARVVERSEIVIPCWSNDLGRTGQIAITRGNVSGQPLYIQMNSCTGSSSFGGTYLRFDMEDALFVSVRAADLRTREVLWFESARIQSDESYMPFSPPRTGLFEPLTSNSGFHAHLFGDSSSWVRTGPRLKVKFYSVANGSSVFTPVNGSATHDSEEVIAFIDYVVTFRASNVKSAYEAAIYFKNRPGYKIQYCQTLGSFIPSNVCETRPTNSTEPAGCPSAKFSAYSNYTQTATGRSCWAPGLAQAMLGAYTPIPTTPSTPTAPWRPRTTPWSYPDYNDDIYYYRNVGLGVGAGFTLLSLCCAVLRYCGAAKARRERNARHAVAVATITTSNMHQSPSGDNVRVFGATEAFVQPSGTNGFSNQNFIGAPPSYDQIFKPFGAQDKADETPTPETAQDSMTHRPVFVVPQPSVAPGLNLR